MDENMSARVENMIEQLRAEVAGMRSEMTGMRSEMTGMRSEMTTGFAQVRAEMAEGFEQARKERDELRAQLLANIEAVRDDVRMIAAGHATLERRISKLERRA